MSATKHLRLFVLATIAWLAFWLLGWPSYYQQYSEQTMRVFSLVLLVAIIVLLPCVLTPIRRPRRMFVACWMSFYFTGPLAVYDALYCGVYLGHGWSFVWRYWYLTIYYVIPWIVLPGVARVLNWREGLAESKGAA